MLIEMQKLVLAQQSCVQLDGCTKLVFSSELKTITLKFICPLKCNIVLIKKLVVVPASIVIRLILFEISFDGKSVQS